MRGRSDRYEVLCERIAPFPESRDRYHFAKNAMEAARALERIGLARRVVVIRLTDNTVLYDPVGDSAQRSARGLVKARAASGVPGWPGTPKAARDIAGWGSARHGRRGTPTAGPAPCGRRGARRHRGVT